MQKKLKKAALGKSTFASIHSRGLAYVDKTQFIERLEETEIDYPLIVRPRRFGKSLFVNILMQYYDKAATGDFEKNFKGTYIYEHKTPLQGTFYVLRLEFAGIKKENAEGEFLGKAKDGVQLFFNKYPMKGSEEFLWQTFSSPADFISAFFRFVSQFLPNQSVYVVIDEYDQFANSILSSDPKAFKKITSTDGFVKNFYARIKDWTDTLVARVFITGVTSISLDSLTSGFSIATNLTFESEFSEMFGFTDDEVRSLIREMVDLEKYGHTEDEVFARIKDLYDGYRFSRKNKNGVFNASACLYYLTGLARNNEEPDSLMDESFAQDLSKIHGILSLASLADRREVVSDVLSGKTIELGSLKKVINLNDNHRFDRDDLLSTLVYMGFLTFASGKSGQLVCPNKVILDQFFKYYFACVLGTDSYAPGFEELVERFALMRRGDAQPFLTYIYEKLTKSLGVHDSAHFTEHSAQVAILSNLLFFSDYETCSEVEIRDTETKGYADVVVLPKDDVTSNYAYLIEVKYIAASSVKSEDAKAVAVARAFGEAKEQLARYAEDERFSAYPLLKKVAVVFVGTRAALIKETGDAPQ